VVGGPYNERGLASPYLPRDIFSLAGDFSFSFFLSFQGVNTEYSVGDFRGDQRRGC
jgi:hypothetical protein